MSLLAFGAATSTPPTATATVILPRAGPLVGRSGNGRFIRIHSSLGTSSNSNSGRINENLGAKGLTHSLTRNWDVSNYAAPSWLPRFEDLDTTNMLLRQRTIFLGSHIDDITADFVICQLLLLDSEDQKKDIRLLINSTGGSVTAAMGIYDAMKVCKADVSTICMGFAASVAAFVLASGTKGKRFCMPNSRVMIRQLSGVVGGFGLDNEIQIRELAYQRFKLQKILSRITGKPEKQIDMDTKIDNYMNAWEARDYGLVDAVIDDGKPGLVAPIADASPPPDIFWKLCVAEGVVNPENLPSEEKLLQNGSGRDDGASEETTKKTEEK